MKCGWCVFRARHVGGNGNCPILHRATTTRLNNRGNLVEERETAEQAWPRHLQVNAAGCSNFKAGDLRLPPVPVEQESLFG